jgi:glycosidase
LLFQVVIPAVGISLVTAVHAAPYPSPADWRNENIYQIFTDRFNDGDPSNNNVEAGRGEPYSPVDAHGIHGGDFKGIQQKLDYIKALGATAIWISPIPLNVADGSSAYHGYAAQDFYTLAPHWGTMADLSNMVQAAHAHGIKVILDIVCNHTGHLLISTDPGWPNYLAPPAGYNLQYININNQHAFPFNPTNVIPPLLSTIFHTNGFIQDFGNTQEVVLGALDGLDDLATETTYVRTNMMNIYTNWVGRADFDGFRVDTTRHVDYGFWQYWCPQLHQFGSSIGKSNLFMFGEVWDSDSACGSYTGTQGGGPFKMDSTLDYPLFFTINPVFSQAYANTSQIEDHYNAIAANYDSNAWYRLITFLDNHDNARFLSPGNANGDTNRLTVALEFLYTSRGIPCLYYGTEQAFNGTGDPNNREDMFAGQFEQGPSLGDNFDEAHPLFQLVARLNNFRRLYPALRTGVHNNLWSDPSGPGLFAYSRVLSNQEVFVCFNTATASETLTNRPTTYAPGTVLVNLLNTNDTIVVTTALGTNATPLITVPSMTARIYISRSLVLPLDPVVVSQSPSHAATCVAASAPIVLQFSKPMNTNSVQAAFSVTPSTTGTFTWNSIHDTVTFTPSTPWPVLTTNLVHLATNAMDSVNGNLLYAPFDTWFVTSSTNTITTSSSPPAGGTTSGGGAVNCGSNVTVCATPNACYSFLYWSQNGSLVSTSACYSFSDTGNVAIVANFVNGQGTLATDNAADPLYASGSWTNTLDGGTGFSPWSMVTTTPFPPSGCNGFFVSTSIASSPHAAPGIDVNGESWGAYANTDNCGEPTIAAAFRPFATGPIQPGGHLLLNMQNGLNDNFGSAVGFALRNGNSINSPTDYTTGARLQFYLGGWDTDYTVVDAAGARDTGVPLTYSGLHLNFTPGANDSYSLLIISYGSGKTNVVLGTLAGAPNSTLDSIALFNNDAGTDSPHDVFFNSLTVANVTPITFTINTSSSPPAGGTTSGGGTVNCGSNVTVCATPNPCYQFVNWTENGNVIATSPCLPFQANGNHTFVANFTNSTADTVGDGILDCWRQRYFGGTGTSTNASSCATCDADGTGQNNRFKFVAGLDPTNPASLFVLQVQNVPNQPTHKNLMYWPIATGCTYVVESTTDLVSGVWSPQPVSAPLTNGTQVTVMDPNATGPLKFYRLEIYNVITNIVIQDSVGDMISDGWRAQFFGGGGTSTNNLSCAACDADGTGQNNLFKYVTGLDPTNPSSVFVLQITSPTNRPAQNNLSFTPLALGRSYTPQFTTNLASGSWFALTTYTGPVTNNGNQITITDTNPIPPQEFYRIGISPP